jgi:hypothetical protein
MNLETQTQQGTSKTSALRILLEKKLDQSPV